MLAVEQHHTEPLDRAGAVHRQKVSRRRPWARELRPLRRRSRQRASAELDRRRDTRRLGRADPGHIAELSVDEPRQAVDAARHAVGDVERTRPGCAVAQNDGQQLVVAEHRGAESFELLSRAIVWGERAHPAHHFKARAAGASAHRTTSFADHSGKEGGNCHGRRRGSTRLQLQTTGPAATDGDLGPAGEVEPIRRPFDALRAARRHDVDRPLGSAVDRRGDRGGARTGT